MTARNEFAAGLEKLLEGIEEIKEGLSSEEVEIPVDDEGAIPPSPLLKNPEALLPVLLEHRDDRPDGRCLIPAPVTTLQARAHLLPSEAQLVLEALVSRQLIQKVGNWESALVPQSSQMSKRDDHIIALPRIKLPVHASPKTKIPSIRTPTQPIMKPVDVTHKPQELVLSSVPVTAQAYNLLKARCMMMEGKGVVRGPVMALQASLGIAPADAEALLHILLSQGHIEEIDGFRSVRLLSESAEATAAKETTSLEAVKPAVADTQKGENTAEQVETPVEAAALPVSETVDVVKETESEPENVVKITSLQAARAYDLLRARSVIMDGRKILRGPLSLLHASLHISAKEAERILKDLQDQHHIEQIDGWRAIYLLSDKVQVMETPEKKPAAVEPVQAKPKPAVRPEPRLKPDRPKPVNASSLPDTGFTPELAVGAIQLVESLLPQLKQTRDNITNCVAQLESALERLRALSGAADQQQKGTAEMIRNIIATNEELRKLLG